MSKDGCRSVNVVLSIADLVPERGGPSRTVPALSSALGAEGMSVTLVTLDCCGESGRKFAPPPPVRTEFVRCTAPGLKQARWTPQFDARLRACCLTAGATILHDTGLWLPTNHAAASVARKLRLPFIVSPRGMLTQWSMAYRGWKKKLAWRLYQRRDLESAQILHATSREELDGFRAVGLRQPVALVPNGVEFPPWKELPPRETPTRTVLVLCRIHPVKGLLNLVEAWASLRPEGWQVLLAGKDEGGHQREVETAIRDHHLEKAFSFCGPVDGDDKWPLYREADLFALPSHTENFGLVVAEALACGLPVITTQGTPWRELHAQRCGWWVPLGTEPLANALREATGLTDADRRAMGRRGRRLIESNYGWPLVAKKMVAVYGWMLGQNAKPDWIIT